MTKIRALAGNNRRSFALFDTGIRPTRVGCLIARCRAAAEELLFLKRREGTGVPIVGAVVGPTFASGARRDFCSIPGAILIFRR